MPISHEGKSSSVGKIEAIRRIIFIRTDRLGETLLNLPAISALKSLFPQSSLTVLVQPQLKELLQGLPFLDSIICLPQYHSSSWWGIALRLASELRARNFDLAIVSNPKKELHLAVWLAGIPIRAGYSRKWGCLLTNRIADCKALGERHEVEYNLDLIRALGISASPAQIRLPVFEREEREIFELLQNEGVNPTGPFIAVHPWSSNKLKQWPADRFKSLIQLARTKLSANVVLIGGNKESSAAWQFPPLAFGCADLVGKLNLRQLAQLLRHARLLISNDSGPVHVASAVGTKTVVLFGTLNPASGPKRWGPWGEGHTIIWKQSMEDITVEEVFSALQHQISA